MRDFYQGKTYQVIEFLQSEVGVLLDCQCTCTLLLLVHTCSTCQLLLSQTYTIFQLLHLCNLFNLSVTTSLQPVQSVSYYLSATCSVCQLLHLCNLLNLSVITFRNLPTETVNYNICTPVQTDIDSDEIQNALLCNKMFMKIVYTVRLLVLLSVYTIQTTAVYNVVKLFRLLWYIMQYSCLDYCGI